MFNKCYALVLLPVLLAGCATWVNIPAEPGDLASHDPNLETVLKIDLQAVRAVLNTIDPEAPVHIILPPGTVPLGYEAVVPKVNEKAAWSVNPPPPGALVLEVRQVRVRGSFAQADVIAPADPTQRNGPKIVNTVYLHYDVIAGWDVTQVRAWPISVDAALVKSVREAEIDIKQ
jgi:hypothetical protein